MWVRVFAELEVAESNIKVSAELSDAFQVGPNEAVMMVWSVEISE